MGATQESLTISSFLILLFLVFLILLIANKRGFYTLSADDEKQNLSVSIFQLLIAFLLFFAVTLSLSFLGKGAAVKLFALLDVAQDPYPARLLAGIFTICGTTLALFIYAKTNLFRRTPLLSVAALFKGAISWFIAYPQMMIITIVLNFLLVEFFQLTPEDQSSVAELKRAKSYPQLFYLMIATITLIVPLCEELLFRGYLQTFLKRFLSKGPAILITSCVFALFHYSDSQGAGNLVILPSLLFFSLYLGFVYEKWGSLSACYGLHAFFNAMSSLMISFDGV